MKKFILILIPLFTACASQPVKWDKTDKVLMGSFTALEITDYIQTIEIMNNPIYYEKNPIIKNLNKNEVPIYFAGCILGTWTISNKLKSRPRKIFLIGMNLFQSFFVSHNYHIGISLKF